MRNLCCPYCEIKKDAETKRHYEMLQAIEGMCPNCGAHLDLGQRTVELNGYADIYRGVISIMEEVIQQVNNLMDYLGVETEVDEDTPRVVLSTNEIVRTIFAPYVGGTTISNLKKAINIKEDTVQFEVKP